MSQLAAHVPQQLTVTSRPPAIGDVNARPRSYEGSWRRRRRRPRWSGWWINGCWQQLSGQVGGRRCKTPDKSTLLDRNSLTKAPPRYEGLRTTYATQTIYNGKTFCPVPRHIWQKSTSGLKEGAFVSLLLCRVGFVCGCSCSFDKRRARHRLAPVAAFA